MKKLLQSKSTKRNSNGGRIPISKIHQKQKLESLKRPKERKLNLPRPKPQNPNLSKHHPNLTRKSALVKKLPLCRQRRTSKTPAGSLSLRSGQLQERSALLQANEPRPTTMRSLVVCWQEVLISIQVCNDLFTNSLGELQWFQCTVCKKWRRLITKPGEKAPPSWTCNDNPNRKFKPCTKPQELSNAEVKSFTRPADMLDR